MEEKGVIIHYRWKNGRVGERGGGERKKREGEREGRKMEGIIYIYLPINLSVVFFLLLNAFL